MKKTKAFIVEDNSENLQALTKLLLKECPQVEILGSASSVQQGINMIPLADPDLVFLDVELKNDLSFSILEKLAEQDRLTFEVIFITAYGRFDYATKAISFSAIEFLTKPIDSKLLKNAVEKATKTINKQLAKEQIELLLDNLKTNEVKQRIGINIPRGKIQIVLVNEIISITADGTISKVNLAGSHKLLGMKNLGYYTKLLQSNEQPFFLISNSTLINLNYLKTYDHSKLELTLKDGSTLKASRRKGKQFKDFLKANKHIGQNSNHLFSILKKWLS